MAVVLAWLLYAPTLMFAAPQGTNSVGIQFDLQAVVQRLDQGKPSPINVYPWWNEYAASLQRTNSESVQVDPGSLLMLAIENSNEIKIAAAEPQIRRAVVREMSAGFDWTHYVDGSWRDTSDPTGSTLTAGDGISRFNDHQLSAESGLRRQLPSGGQFEVSQNFGWQDNNSSFLTPPNQANSRLNLSYTHPLLRGRGHSYNTSLVVLAKLELYMADEQFVSGLENHLLEIIRSYWSLYRERAMLAQQVRLLIRTEEIVEILAARQQFDTQRTQFVSARAALESRKSALLQTKYRINDEEARLRGLINANELGQPDNVEIVPVEAPSQQTFNINIREQLELAVRSRPEARLSQQRIQVAATQLGVAEHETLPRLDLVTQGYLSGLQGDANFGQSFFDQFSDGAPSYNVGLNYEMPIGNRAALARKSQRETALERVQREYDQTLQVIQTEVSIAVRRLNTSRDEILSLGRALKAAESEAQTLRLRWDAMMDRGQNSGLNLEALLRALERVTDLETQYLNASIGHNLAIIELKKANGTLLGHDFSETASQTALNGKPATQYATQASYQARTSNPNRRATKNEPDRVQSLTSDHPAFRAATFNGQTNNQPRTNRRSYGNPTDRPPDPQYAELKKPIRISTPIPPPRKFRFPLFNPEPNIQKPVHAKPFSFIPSRPIRTADFGRPVNRY